jgi:hypothetical protein
LFIYGGGRIEEFITTNLKTLEHQSRRMQMRKRLLFILLIILILIPTGIAQAKKPFRISTEYYFVGHLGIFDAEMRLLGWQGTVSGDIEGVIKWWMVVPFKYSGQVNHFEARWEIWNIEETDLLLAGEEFGSTTDRPGKNGVWRANGVVTEAHEDYNEWVGRQMHDGGEFIWVIPGLLPSNGWGEFRIN